LNNVQQQLFFLSKQIVTISAKVTQRIKIGISQLGFRKIEIIFHIQLAIKLFLLLLHPIFLRLLMTYD